MAAGALFEVVAGSDGSALLDRWRELGPMLWLVAAGVTAAWLMMLAVLAVVTQTREPDPQPATLDLGGSEPPAVVNLITSQWRLGHEALPATLLDLAARDLFSIEQVGEATLVRPRPESERRRERVSALEPYERMVYEHVVHQATDGVVPADALTTGPEEQARGWWQRFRRSVERDGRQRGLSRRRWSAVTHTVLVAAAFVVAATVAVAASTLPDDPEESDDGPVGAAIGFGIITLGGLVAAVEVLNGERDTAEGRTVAGRWLGLRTQLAEDPLFAEYPPAGVAIWDRLLAYGAAMGVAHGAVRAIPMGAESDREAWSSVGGRWRVVRIRYPHFLPPGYGRHPGMVLLLGIVQLGLAALAFPAVRSAAPALLDAATDFTPDQTVPAGVRLFVTIAVAVVVGVGMLLALRGAAMLVSGVADAVRSRRTVEGRVLRVRRRGGDDRARWYVAVDDGSADQVRAWRTSPGAVVQGSTARATVSRWLAHVRELHVVSAAPRPPLVADVDEPEDGSAPLSALLGTVGSAVAGVHQPMPAVTGPPPPLPDAATVGAIAGHSLHVDTNAPAHPLAVNGASVTFRGDGGATLQVAWVDPGFLRAHRALPRFLRRDLPGVGEEAYRAVIGGAVVARHGGSVLLVMGQIPGMDGDDRDRAFAEIARAAMDGA